MDQFMKAIGSLIKLMEEVELYILTEMHTKENGKIIWQMVMVFFMTLMDLYMRENGYKIKKYFLKYNKLAWIRKRNSY